MSRMTTKGGVGQTVFAMKLPLRYSECAKTEWVYSKPIETHFAIASMNRAAFERVKQDESDTGLGLPSKQTSNFRLHPRTGKDGGLLPESKGVWLELIKHLTGSAMLQNRVTHALSGYYGR